MVLVFMTRDHTRLMIWKEAHALTVKLYKLTAKFPKEEQFGLVQQIRRASSSIGANIAEGCGQRTTPAMKRFLFMSLGSIKELENHLLLAKDLRYLSPNSYKIFNEEIKNLGRMLQNFKNNMS